MGRPKIIGEVLFDRFPNGTQSLGGAPFNVAWHLHGFGANPLLLSCIGDDAEGERVRRAMDDWGMDPSGVRTDPDHPTGAVDIRFSGRQHRFDILANQAYDHITHEQLEAAVLRPDTALIYLGTLIMRTDEMHSALRRLLTATTAPIFVDVNLREPFWRAEDLPWLVNRCTWIKVNDEELEIIAANLQLPGKELESKARSLLERFSLELLILTLGSAGARGMRSGMTPVSVKSELTENVVDTVGAGDAFASVSILGLMQGWPLTTTLQRAQWFASRIVQQRGATSPNHDLYAELKTAWGLR